MTINDIQTNNLHHGGCLHLYVLEASKQLFMGIPSIHIIILLKCFIRGGEGLSLILTLCFTLKNEHFVSLTSWYCFSGRKQTKNRNKNKKKTSLRVTNLMKQFLQICEVLGKCSCVLMVIEEIKFLLPVVM